MADYSQKVHARVYEAKNNDNMLRDRKAIIEHGGVGQSVKTPPIEIRVCSRS